MADRLNKDKPFLLERPWMRPLKLGKLLSHREALVAGTTLDNVKAMAVTKQVHTSGGPRRRPCLGEGRGRRILGVIQQQHRSLEPGRAHSSQERR